MITGLLSGIASQNLLVESPGKMIQPSSHVRISVFLQELFILRIFSVLPKDDLQIIPSNSTSLLALELNQRLWKGSLPGNNKTSFEERTGLLLFREGSLTKSMIVPGIYIYTNGNYKSLMELVETKHNIIG